jgi:hypothetical protein
MTKTVLIFTTLLLGTGCVTVKLGGQESQRADGVTFRDPPSPFVRDNRIEVDAAFKNPRNGNVISYLSDCKDPTDPPLDSIVTGVLAGLTEMKTESKEPLQILGREGRRVVAHGKVDGVLSGIELLVFKRNQCVYILSYVGVKDAFSENRADFNRFIEGFRVP